MTADTEAQRILTEHSRIWHRKPTLRRIYREEFFARLLSYRQPSGVSIELGAGPGFLREMLPGVLLTDVIWSPWLNAVVDAQALPFKSATIANLMGLDMLHHLAGPLAFLREAERVLIPGGRLILVEPWITPVSYLIYRYLHQEKCDLDVSSFDNGSIRHLSDKKAFDGNQAIPYLLFGPRARESTLALLPHFRIVELQPFSLFAYVLSFGFKRFNLLPEILYPVVSRLERSTLPLWRSLAALRVLLVLEKSTI